MRKDMFHYHNLQKLRTQVFRDPFKESDISDILVIKKNPFYLIQKQYNKYLISVKDENGKDIIDQFPIVPIEFEDMPFGSKMYKVITAYNTLNIKGEKNLTIRELVDKIAPFKHTQPLHFTVYKIAMITALFSRVNLTISTEASFGKDSFIDILSYLNPDISKTTPTSMASIIYRLDNRLLALNEISDLKSEDMVLLERFMSTAGAFNNIYENPKRASLVYGTKDKYNISNLSLVLLYNNYEYFISKNKEKKYFDVFFKEHIRDRFLSLRFDGVLDEDFSSYSYDITDKDLDDYKALIRTIKYYVDNPLPPSQEENNMIDKLKLSKRQIISLKSIVAYIKEYAEGDEVLYNDLLYVLFGAIQAYKSALQLHSADLRYDKNNRVKCFTHKDLIERRNRL